MLSHLANWLIPSTCLVCGFKTKASFCNECLIELPWLPICCITCGEELPLNNQQEQCGECLIDPPPIDRAVILFNYRSPIPSLIAQLKFQKKLFIASPLGTLLGTHVQKIYQDQQTQIPQCIIPVPLDKKRLRTRGFNQALEIARPIKKLLDSPIIDFKSLKRIRPTAPQTLLEIQDRKVNIKNAFQMVKPIPFKHVAIVDDVVTTFSTMSEIAKELRKNGIQKIDAWCIAKATRRK